MTEACLVFLRREGEILLAMKKRGFGVGKLNGPGGKVEPGETFAEAAAREVHEEIGVRVGPLTEVATLKFHMDEYDGHIMKHILGTIFICDEWTGEPTESEEMAPALYPIDAIPYDRMWSDDIHWLPDVLAGHYIDGEFWFDANDVVRDMKIYKRPLSDSR